jgi:hypothetical protein
VLRLQVPTDGLGALMQSKMTTQHTVDQTKATAGGDVVGGDKIVHYAAPAANPLGALLEKLRAEVDGDQKVQACLDELQHYHQKSAHDGVAGLKAKLEKSHRNDEYHWAVEQKEKFAKVLAKWSLYSSAQELFVYLLSRADYQFNQFILPKLEELAPEEINELFDKRIVEPTVAECSGPVLRISHSVAIGMVYWLAEQCFIRWHK